MSVLRAFADRNLERLSALVLALAAAGFACAFASDAAAKPDPSNAGPRKLFVNLPHDIYGMIVPIDQDHDTRSCDRPVELRSGQVPSNYRFLYFPCTGAAFNAQMAGATGLVAVSQAEGKIFQVYAGVRFNGKDFGRVIVIYTPPQKAGAGVRIAAAPPRSPTGPNAIAQSTPAP